jgi:hypothetical protein
MKLGRYIEYLWIDGPFTQVSHCTFKEGRHACIAGLYVPVMACVIRIWPRYANQTYKMANWILLGMSVQQLAYLWPNACQSIKDSVI